ncbi:heptatricopeptide repeat-containing protein, putative [Plasmodium vivax]|uniref:Heptatricopeptide repeat-containing protein, putative n=1 Tax=Plasmodium vivax TaxID=5855 RepID=A0A564ZVU1_PLAVI|nr:heptatricopeptide repeat-containing protein, putative [Plasmodium vivax]
MRSIKNELFRSNSHTLGDLKRSGCLGSLWGGSIHGRGAHFLKPCRGEKHNIAEERNPLYDTRERKIGSPLFSGTPGDHFTDGKAAPFGDALQKGKIGELLKHAVHNVKAHGGKGSKLSDNALRIVERIFKNNLLVHNLSFIHFNMLLTVISKGEIKMSKDMQNGILHLLHKHISPHASHIDNTGSAWINIAHLLSSICRNDKVMLRLLRKKNQNVASGDIKEDAALPFVDKFVRRICQPSDFNYSIREMSLLLHSCYHLNLRSCQLFDAIFDELQKKEHHFNCLDVHIFVYAVYKLQLQRYAPFLEKLKKNILQNVSHFSSGQMVNILLAYTYFYLKEGNGKLPLKTDPFMSTIYETCWHMVSHFSNREFCNFLNFIIQNEVSLREEQRSELFGIIFNLLKSQHSNRLKLNQMIDLDVFTIVNFAYKYGNCGTASYMRDMPFEHLDQLTAQLIGKNKFAPNLLVYLLHFYKQRVASYTEEHFIRLHFFRRICVNSLDFKMKVILLTSVERYLPGGRELPTGVAKSTFCIKEYYLNLVKSVYDDLCRGESTPTREGTVDTSLKPNSSTNRVVISNTDIKEILKWVRSTTQDEDDNHQHCDAESSGASIERETLKWERMLLDRASEYVTKNNIVELFPLILVNRHVHTGICNKAEEIINDHFDNLNEYLQCHEGRANGMKKYDRSKNVFHFFHALNLCNECIFTKMGGGNVTQFVTKKKLLLSCIDLTPMSKENEKDYFALHVHMLLFDINNNLDFFTNHLLAKISNYLKTPNLSYENILVSLVDIFSSIIKVQPSYYDAYLSQVYKHIFPPLFCHYEKLNCKHLSLLFYANLIHLLLHLYKRNVLSNHITLSIRLMKKLFSHIVNSMDEATYKLTEAHCAELSEWHKRDRHRRGTPSLLLPLNELIYIYRVLTIFHFADLYAHMDVQELKCFYAFYKALNFSIFKVHNFCVTEFTQTNRGASNVHTAVVNSLNGLFKTNERVKITCEQVVFPLFIIDILIDKR